MLGQLDGHAVGKVEGSGGMVLGQGGSWNCGVPASGLPGIVPASDGPGAVAVLVGLGNVRGGVGVSGRVVAGVVTGLMGACSVTVASGGSMRVGSGGATTG
jgi:hypothetical protein